MRQEDETTLDLLRKVPLFADCSPDELRQIAAIADELSFREGEDLTRQGGPGREMFILLEGREGGAKRRADQHARAGRLPGRRSTGAREAAQRDHHVDVPAARARDLEGNFKQLLATGASQSMVHETLAARTPPEESD